MVKLIYKDKDVKIERRLHDTEDIDLIVRELVWMLQGATWNQSTILAAMKKNADDMQLSCR